MAKLLLDAGVNVNAINTYDETPLHHAALQSHADMVALFIKYGANVNAKNDLDYTPLHLALSIKGLQNKTEALAVSLLLVRGGANYLMKNDDNLTPLDQLGNDENSNKMKTLILEEAEKVGPKKALVTIKEAADLGLWDVVKEHIADKVNIDKMKSNGQVSEALIAAIEKDNLEIAKLLLDTGADPNVKGSLGRSVVLFALLTYSNPKMLELLLVSGAKIDEEFLGVLNRQIDRYQYPNNKKILSSVQKIVKAKAILEKQSQNQELTADEANLRCLDNLEGGPDMKRRFLKVHDPQNKLLALQQKLKGSRKISNRQNRKNPGNKKEKRRWGFRKLSHFNFILISARLEIDAFHNRIDF